jgi:hypothetical protein
VKRSLTKRDFQTLADALGSAIETQMQALERLHSVPSTRKSGFVVAAIEQREKLVKKFDTLRRELSSRKA